MFWRLAAIVASLCLIQGILSDDVNPCRRQPFRGRCPSLNGATPMRSQFVLRYYLRGGECVSYPYGHCANDDNEPKLFRYKEECEDACVKQANSPTTVKPKESDSLVVDPSEVVETGTEAPQSSGEFTYATGGVESTTGSYETPKTECQRQRDTRGQGLIKGGFIPECSANGEFKQLQCEQDKSECFCVNAEGIEIDNSRTKAGQEKPDCEKIISASSLQTNECVGGAETGPCRSSIPRFYYDEPTQSCQQFLYSGCGGNGNNYPTQAACEHRCVPPKEAGKCHKGKDPLRTSQGQLVNCAKTECPAGYKCSVIQHSSVCCPDDEKSVVGVLHSGIGAAACELPKERGPCDRYELRFYFNKELNECKYFFYGGCEGNDNNFARVEECEKTCGAKVSGDSPPPQAPFVETKQTQPTTTTTERATTTTARATTQAPTTTTPTTTVPPTTSTAEQTATTTERERPTQPTFHLPRDESIEVRTFPSVTTPELPTDRCLHPRDEGSCGGQFVRWLWNNENRKCESFAYTGCGGNGNNFASMEECLSICHIEVAKPEPLPEVVNVCETAVDAGDCSGTFMRYAFEPSTNDCHQFAYTGCGGNGNNFATISDCRKKCVPQKGPETTEPTTASTALNVSLQITPTKNICDHPIEIGECSGIFHRFAYDGESNECRQFEYGGCGGNGNNFATITECRLACVRTRCPPPPTCDTSRCQVVNDVRGCPFCSCPPPPQHPPIIPNFQPEPQCPPLDVNLCVEPCIIFSNRRGCKECVCPVLPNQLPPQSLPPSRPTQHQAPVPPPPAPDVSMPRSIVKPSPTPPQLPRPTEAPTTQEPIQFVPQQPFVRPPAPQQPQHPAPPRFEPEQTPQPPRFNPQPPAPPAPIRAPSAPAPPAPPAPRFNTNNIIQPVIQGVTNNVDEKPLQLPPQRPRATIADLGEKCTQPVDPGPCKNFVERWHFNEQQGECEPFSYGGCAGNRNHFFSRRECEIHCARFSRVPRPIVEINEVVIETPRPVVVTFPSSTTPPPTTVQTRPPRPHSPQTPPSQAPIFIPTQQFTTLPPPTTTPFVRTQPPRHESSVTSTVFISLSTTPPPPPLIQSTIQPFISNFVPNNQNWQARPNTLAPPLPRQEFVQQSFVPQQQHQLPLVQHLPTFFIAPAQPPPRQEFAPPAPTNPPQTPWTQPPRNVEIPRVANTFEPPRFNTNPSTIERPTTTLRISTATWQPRVLSTFAPSTQRRFETTTQSTTLPPSTTTLSAPKIEQPTNPPFVHHQQQWQQERLSTIPPNFVQTNPPFVRHFNTGFTQPPPPQRPIFVQNTSLPPQAPPASPPLFHSHSQQQTFVSQNNAAIPAQPLPQRPVERIVPLQPIAQQPQFHIPTLPPKRPLPDVNKQFAQPTFNQAAFEKALPPTPSVGKSEYQPPNPPIRTDFNPYIPPTPQTREGYAPVQPAVHRPVNPQDQWPANTRKPAGGSYGMEEITPNRGDNHIHIQPLKPAETPVVHHQWPVTTPQPTTIIQAVPENKPENLVPIFAASSHPPPQQIPTTTPIQEKVVQPAAPIAPPRIIQPVHEKTNNEYSNVQSPVETSAPSKAPTSNNVPQEYGGESETIQTLSPVVSHKTPEVQQPVNENINHEYSSGPEKVKPNAPAASPEGSNGTPINHEYSSGPETEKPSSPFASVEKSLPSAPVTSAPTASPTTPEATTTAVKASLAPSAAGYEETQQEITSAPTKKPEAPTSAPANVETQKPATNYETAETPEESLVVLDKVSSEAGPKAEETSSNKEEQYEVKETKEPEKTQPLPNPYEISDITASSTSAPVKVDNHVEAKPTANVDEYRVFGEKSNTQKAIEPSKIPEKNNLGKTPASIENNIRLQIVDGGSDRSVGRKPIALPEGFVNIPINKEMEKALLEAAVIPHHSANGGSKGKSIEGEVVNGHRGEGMTTGVAESSAPKNVKVEFSTSEPAQTETAQIEKIEVVKEWINVDTNTVQPNVQVNEKQVETEAETFIPPTPPKAPVTLSTPPPSRLTFAENEEKIVISKLSTDSTIQPTTSFEKQTTTEEVVTVPTTRKLIRIQPIHPTITTEPEEAVTNPTNVPVIEEVETITTTSAKTEFETRPTTSQSLVTAEHVPEKILAPTINGDIEEQHPHDMLEEVAVTHVKQEKIPEISATTEKATPELPQILSTTENVPAKVSESQVVTTRVTETPVQIVKETVETVQIQQIPNTNLETSEVSTNNVQTNFRASNVSHSMQGVKSSVQSEIKVVEPEIQTAPVAHVESKEPTIIYQSSSKTVQTNEGFNKSEESKTVYTNVQTSSQSTSNQQQVNIERQEIIEAVTTENVQKEEPPTQLPSTLPPIVSSPLTITLPSFSTSNPSPPEPVEENNINEAFTVEPKRVTRPPTTTLPPQPIPDEENTDDMMVEPQPAPVFTPRPVFRPIPTTGSPPPSVEKVTIFGPPQKPEFDPEACVMPPDAGRCRNFVARWFYNAERGSCQEFSYGSCGGNANNFADKATCEARCVPSVNAVLPQRCNWPKDEGFGNGYHPKWYFNSRNLRCEQMVFRGSGGNDNQFSSQGDCDLSCKPVHGSFVPQPPPRKGHKETDKKQPLPSAHGSITQGGGYDGLPSPVHELPASAPAPAPYAPTANAPAEKQPTAPASGPAPATAPQAPSVNVNQYVPATPPLRPEYNSVEEPRAPAPVAPSAPAPGPTSSVPSQAPASHSSSNSNVGGVESEGYSGQGQGSAPSVPVAPPTHNVAPEETSSSHGQSPNHEAGIGVGRADYEEPTVPGINHEAGIGTQPSKSESNNVETETVDQTGANAPDSNIEGGQSSNNVEESHGSAATDSNTQGSKYESNNENIESGGSATGPETPAAPANTQVHSSGGNSNNNYHAIPAETQMVETPDSHLPMLGLSPKMEIDYQKGERLDNGPKAHGIQTATGEQIFNGNFDDKSIDAIKLINGDKDEGSREELARIPTCPNGLQAKTYTDGRPVMCLPGKDQCPENSVCYFNGLDFFCCPNADDPYDQHIFGGYDGEEVKHGYKSVPTSLNIRALRRKRQAGGIPPSSFSIDHITKPLRFDDKPVKQISRAGSVDALARLRVNPCTEEVQEGSCNEAHLRYFYDIKTDTCRLFYYSGCDGNANNFITQNECNQRCKLGIVITTTEAPVPPGRCPGGKLPLGDNAPVLCGNQTDSIGCPRGYYCRNGPPDVCCPDEIPDLQTILSQNVNREIRRRPFISAAGKFEGGEHHHHEHEHHHAVHGVATEHVAAGYDADSAGVNTGSASQTNEHEHAAESHTPEGHAAEGHVDESHAEQAHAASEASSGASESAGASGTAATTSAPTATTFGLPENICPDGSDALTEKDGKTTKMCGSGFDGHELCPRGFYCSIDPERNSRLCCPMTLQGSNIPQPPVIAPYFGHRRHNPGEVVERGSLPSDPKPPKLVTPKPKTRMTMEDFENMNAGGESTAEFHPPGGSEGVEKGSNYDENDGMPGARPETETGSQLDSKPDKVPIEENPSDANAVAPAQVQPAQMPTDEGEEEKGPYAHLRLKPFIRQGKLQQSRANDSTAIEDDHVHIRTSSQEDPFEVDGESKKVYKEIFDLSMCQLRPSEGRQCREDEPQPLTNLQYFYSIKDRKCKLFFHRGCGGNSNRFDSKADCEKACSSLMGQ